MIPDMTDVKSSNVKSIGYDANRREVYVTFKDRFQKDKSRLPGGTYAYHDTSADEYRDLAKAPSIGKAIGDHATQKSWHKVDLGARKHA